jgi:DNA-binding transcriptional ArsR family regulator
MVESVRGAWPADTIPLTIGEISRAIGYRPRRVRRWLDRLSQANPHAVQRGPGGRRMASLAGLRTVCPDIGKRYAKSHEIEKIGDEQETQGEEILRIAREHREFSARCVAWLERIEARLAKLEGVEMGQKRPPGQKRL